MRFFVDGEEVGVPPMQGPMESPVALGRIDRKEGRCPMFWNEHGLWHCDVFLAEKLPEGFKEEYWAGFMEAGPWEPGWATRGFSVPYVLSDEEIAEKIAEWKAEPEANKP